jgi:outer membrane protein
MKHLHIFTTAWFLVTAALLQAQNQTDSLTLTGILDAVVHNYPELRKASKDLTAADAKIALSKTTKLPDVVFSAGYNRVGPVSAFNLGGRQVHLVPENMYNATFTLTENLLDFGKTDKNVQIEEKNKELLTLTVDQVRQRLTQAVLGSYYTICFLQEAIHIKDEQLTNLNQHLQFVQKKVVTGSATSYDVLSTKVRISSVENQKIDLQAALEVQTGYLNAFMGNEKTGTLSIKKDELVEDALLSLDELCNQAYANRQEMKLALKKSELLKLKVDAIDLQNKPSLNFQAVGGFKNGYFNPSMEDMGKLNFNVGIGFRVPVFDANRSKYAKVQANVALENSAEDVELLRRNISNEVIENRANVVAALKKTHQCELQVQQAVQAYQLAETSYKNGAITNLDLLDSYTAVSESRLGLYKATTDYQYNLKKLKLVVGAPSF